MENILELNRPGMGQPGKSFILPIASSVYSWTYGQSLDLIDFYHLKKEKMIDQNRNQLRLWVRAEKRLEASWPVELSIAEREPIFLKMSLHQTVCCLTTYGSGVTDHWNVSSWEPGTRLLSSCPWFFGPLSETATDWETDKEQSVSLA